jgi:type IV pilus assembly protein PilN
MRRMGMVVAALAALAVVLLGYILYQRSQTRDVDQQIAQARQEIAALDAERAQAQAMLNQPQNRDVADQSQFLNNLFVRKALSWTRVFGEMEKLMPPNIHVVSMKPEFNRNDQLVLHVVVATTTRDKAVELVQRMEKSPHFHAPQVESESVLGEGATGPAGGNIQFEIAAVYVPFADDSEPADQAKPEQNPEGKPAGKSAPKTSSSGSSTSTGGGR